MDIIEFLANNGQTFHHPDDRDGLPCQNQDMLTSLQQLAEITLQEDYPSRDYRLALSFPLMPAYVQNKAENFDELISVYQYYATFYMYPKTHQRIGANLKLVNLPLLEKFPNLVAYYIEYERGPIDVEPWVPRYLEFSTREFFEHIQNQLLPQASPEFILTDPVLEQLSLLVPALKTEGLLSLFYIKEAQASSYGRRLYDSTNGSIIQTGKYNTKLEPAKILSRKKREYFIITHDYYDFTITKMNCSRREMLRYVAEHDFEQDMYWIVPTNFDYILAISTDGEMYLKLS